MKKALSLFLITFFSTALFGSTCGDLANLPPLNLQRHLERINARTGMPIKELIELGDTHPGQQGFLGTEKMSELLFRKAQAVLRNWGTEFTSSENELEISITPVLSVSFLNSLAYSIQQKRRMQLVYAPRLLTESGAYASYVTSLLDDVEPRILLSVFDIAFGIPTSFFYHEYGHATFDSWEKEKGYLSPLRSNLISQEIAKGRGGSRGKILTEDLAAYSYGAFLSADKFNVYVKIIDRILESLSDLTPKGRESLRRYLITMLFKVETEKGIKYSRIVGSIAKKVQDGLNDDVPRGIKELRFAAGDPEEYGGRKDVVLGTVFTADPVEGFNLLPVSVPDPSQIRPNVPFYEVIQKGLPFSTLDAPRRNAVSSLLCQISLLHEHAGRAFRSFSEADKLLEKATDQRPGQPGYQETVNLLVARLKDPYLNLEPLFRLSPTGN